MKPGWKTSEFWLAAGSQVIVLLVALGVVNAPDASTLSEALAKIVSGGVALVAGATVWLRYLDGRFGMKLLEQNPELAKQADDYDEDEVGDY